MITVSDLRDRVKVSADRESHLEAICAAVIGLWEAQTNGKWNYASGEVKTIRPDNSRTEYIWLPRRPILSVTTVEERAKGSSTWTELESDDYILADASTGELERVNTFWATNVRVTYTAGYDETAAPAAIREALLIQARFMIERYDGEKLTVKGQAAGKGAVTFLETADLHPLFRKVAALHRRASYVS